MRVKLTSSSSDATDVPDIVSAFLELCLALETMSKAARRNIIGLLTVNECVQHDVKIKLRNTDWQNMNERVRVRVCFSKCHSLLSTDIEYRQLKRV